MPWPPSPDSEGPWAVPGTRLCRRRDILPVRAAPQSRGCRQREGGSSCRGCSRGGQRRWGVQWVGSVTTQSLASQGVSLFEILRVSDPVR